MSAQSLFDQAAHHAGQAARREQQPLPPPPLLRTLPPAPARKPGDRLFDWLMHTYRRMHWLGWVAVAGFLRNALGGVLVNDPAWRVLLGGVSRSGVWVIWARIIRGIVAALRAFVRTRPAPTTSRSDQGDVR